LCATGGLDYESRPYTITFSAGITRIPFKVLIKDDDIFEGNEYFNLTIDSSSLSNNVTVANPSQVIVNISDSNDGKHYVQQ